MIRAERFMHVDIIGGEGKKARRLQSKHGVVVEYRAPPGRPLLVVRCVVGTCATGHNVSKGSRESLRLTLPMDAYREESFWYVREKVATACVQTRCQGFDCIRIRYIAKMATIREAFGRSSGSGKVAPSLAIIPIHLLRQPTRYRDAGHQHLPGPPRRTG